MTHQALKGLLVGLLCWGCGGAPTAGEAASLARNELQKAGVEKILLTPSDATTAEGQLLFQVEGIRNGKPVMGAVEVDYTKTPPSVRLDLFETPKEEPR